MEVTDEDIRKLCRQWAFEIMEQAIKDLEGDLEKVEFVLRETAEALLELADD